MNWQDRLDTLFVLAEAIGVTIRREPLGGEGGGICVLRGQTVLFVDTYAHPETQYERTVNAIASLPGLDGHYVRPDIREDIERCRAAREDHP